MWHCVAMLLLPLLDPIHACATGRMRSSSQSRTDWPEESAPYLLAVGAPPLRFQELPPPPDLSIVRPAVAPPSLLATPASETSHQDVIVPVSEPLAARAPAETKIETKETALPPKKPGPAPILPDETRPPIRAEDFLPFFEIPGSRRGPAEVSVSVPVPPSVPSGPPLTPSSATYTQTPR